MNFDFTKTLALIKGGLMEAEATWKSYLESSPSWRDTTIALTGPLLLLNVVLDATFGRSLGTSIFSAFFLNLILSVVGFAIIVFVFNYMTGVFKGKSNFSRAFAAVSLAAIPAWIGGIIAAFLPSFPALLLTLAGGVLSLVFLYKILPLALEIPAPKRVLHFIASLVIVFILNVVVASIFGGAVVSGNVAGSAVDLSSTGSGMFGEIERQGRLMQAAEDDSYTPPKDSKLKKSQVNNYVSVLKKTRAMHTEYTEKMNALSKEMEAKEARGESLSMSDISKAYRGMGGVMAANNMEMEIVKTGDGNWAEHLWVKEQLRTAKIQQGEGSDAIEHNYKLYQRYSEEIDDG